MRELILLALNLLIILVGSAEAGNFKNFQTVMRDQGFVYTPSLNANGFSCYKKASALFFMRDCEGYCCEGFVIADPQSDEFGSGLAVLYGSLQNTLEWKGKESIDPIKMADRVDLLIKQVQDNLRLIAQTKHGNRTEFVFDHLNVRGEFYDAPRKDLKAKMLIKLWIP